MSDFLADAVDKHTDNMPLNKRVWAVVVVALIGFLYARGA